VFVAISKRLEDEIRRLEVEKEIGKTRYGPPPTSFVGGSSASLTAALAPAHCWRGRSRGRLHADLSYYRESMASLDVFSGPQAAAATALMDRLVQAAHAVHVGPRAPPAPGPPGTSGTPPLPTPSVATPRGSVAPGAGRGAAPH